MITPVLISGDVALKLRVSRSNATTTVFTVTALSERFTNVEAVFEYRLPGQDWRSDGVVDLASRDSALLRIPCGTPISMTWNHAANGLTLGVPCEVRLRILPLRSVFTWSGHTALDESISNQSHINNMLGNKIFGLDLRGNWMGINSDGKFKVFNNNGTVFIFNNTGARWAQQIRDGRYLVLLSSSLLELEENGLATARSPIDLSAIDTNFVHFCYSPLTQTVLLSGQANGAVTEIKWDDSAGTVLKSVAVANPSGVCYNAFDQSVWVIADEANNRVVIADTTTASVNTISSVIWNDVTVPLVAPRFVESLISGQINIIEAKGVSRAYGTTAATHPALMRATANEKDFQNLLFAPILRAQD